MSQANAPPVDAAASAGPPPPVTFVPPEPDSSEPPTTFVPPEPDSSEPYLRAVESVMRITLAGFGGALAGLSVSRRRGTFGAATSAATRTVVGGGRGAGNPKASASAPYIDHDLPSTWAVACLAFAGIVEFSRLVSPTSVMLDVGGMASGYLRGGDDRGGSVSSSGERTDIEGEAMQTAPAALAATRLWTTQEACTVGDYAIGGSIAGAVFKGSSVRTRAGERLSAAQHQTAQNHRRRERGGSPASSRGVAPPVRAARTGVMAGFLPGAALGLFAGLAQVGIDRLQDAAQRQLEAEDEAEREKLEKETRRREEEDEEDDKGKIDEIDELEAEVNKLTMEELQKQIEELRGGPAADK